MFLLELENITRSYIVGGSELKVLKGITLTIESGDFVAIMGASGSGKSTLMQIMGLLDRPTSGSYRLLGHEVSRLTETQTAVLRSREIGFIFQMFNLLARTSALDNVVLPMIYTGQGHREEHARELLTAVGLQDRMDHTPSQLSGGQQQRVAIARALANHPHLIFADEPTGNLASDQSEEILAQLKALNAQGTTIVMVTHELDIAAHAQRIIHIKDGLMVGDEKKPSVAPEILNPGPIIKNYGSRLPIRRDDDSMPSPRTSDLGPAVTLAPHEFRFEEVKEYAASALRAVIANKVRSSLSILGILIGVASVITMLAIGRGAQESIQARLRSLGSNTIMMFAGAPSMRGIRGPIGNYSRLTLEDVHAIQRLPNVSDIYGEVEGNVRVVYKDQNWVTEVQGVPINYESIRNATPLFGRFFTANEDQEAARVVLLGQTVVNNLFGQEDPIDKIVELNHNHFRVIGLLPIKGGSGFSDQDDMAVVPITTGMKRLFNTFYLHEIGIQCATPASIPQVIDAIEHLMRKRHHLPPLREDDFTLRNNAELQSTLSGTTQTFSTLLGIVAAISLLVGGVGVMNIMLVSVNERTREIGLRKAIGATRRAILIQFLMEAMLLSLLGGLMGLGLGCSISLLLTYFAGWSAILVPSSMALAFACSAGTGIVFGFWPAYKASLLSPIEALRYE